MRCLIRSRLSRERLRCDRISPPGVVVAGVVPPSDFGAEMESMDVQDQAMEAEMNQQMQMEMQMDMEMGQEMSGGPGRGSSSTTGPRVQYPRPKDAQRRGWTDV